ncbi:MAG: hypothetical protein K9N55_06690 [Phycisphaerae bacterium]|nr:hypothetical protein [Phycisphaerae bacterium]
MSQFLVRVAVVILSLTSTLHVSAKDWTLSQMVTQDAEGKPVYRAMPMDQMFINPWPAALEAEFQARARVIIAAQSGMKVPAGNTYFENEKRTYGYLMAQALGPRGMAAVRDLQVEDAQAGAWHSHTHGIDFYAAFTLKHQMRKYFYFGDLLEPDYLGRMFDGARAWTEQDPLHRPHPAYQGPKSGWGPDAKNSWVDVRGTENLFFMRVTSVYLMAEETGSESTAAQYKKTILDYTKTLYRINMGEWDSENYHGHSFAPLLNLYDFAKDPEVKMAAKACLDWMSAIGAVKYWRGGFNGPTKRDYNHAQPFGGSAANMLWVMFGDTPFEKQDHWESDEVHLITSAYRPPLAVVKLARKAFDRPVELFAAKPSYSATTTFQGQSKPEYLETQYIGHSFQMGSLTCGTLPGISDVCGFKILVYDETEGARTLQAVPGVDPAFPGSPQYQPDKVSAENRVAQHGNLALWLVHDGRSPWRWVIPESVKVSLEQGVTFLECDRTWVAIHPLAANALVRDDDMTRHISEGDKARFPGHQVLATSGTGEAFCGLAVEVGEAETYGSFVNFQQQALAAKVTASRIEQGDVQVKSSKGKTLRILWQDDPTQLKMYRDGHLHDPAEHAKYLYANSSGEAHSGPIYSRWGEGSLTVEAGGETFFCHVSETGKATFRHGKP